MDTGKVIRIINASENNLKSVSLDIPRNSFIVVTGVSGSGKSSLVFDVINREAESRYFGAFSSYARQFLGKMKRPEVESIEGLSPAVAVSQGAVTNNPRSTVGTISGIYDHLRLLYARNGTVPAHDSPVADHLSQITRHRSPITDHRFLINRSLFSFNSADGACEHCKGLGVEDRLDPALLIEDATKSIRQRAMAITTPNGYIMYSQVTLDVLDQVCRSEGFNIDIPWKDLTPENRQVIFYGSDKIEIPFGKHPLESRMKWSGITAKPREMGVYKGIIPVMEEILKRDRNKNILRFVRTSPCSSCMGKRLNQRALSVRVGEWDIAALSEMPVSRLAGTLQTVGFPVGQRETADDIIRRIVSMVGSMKQLGLGHLSAGRESGSLSAGESRRLKLATQLGSGLSGITYVLDEPSIGLQDTEVMELISVLKQIRDQGNTVIVVEHDEEFIRHADHLVDIGPGPGVYGGEVLVNCPAHDLEDLPSGVISQSKTLSYFFGLSRIEFPSLSRSTGGELSIYGAAHHNLKHISVHFLLNALNVVTGVSGAGKSSLVHQTLGSFLRTKLNGSNEKIGKHDVVEGWESLTRVVEIDQSPIGRTPRSNPATYTGLFDHIRDLFAALPESLARGYGKSRFSFNTMGGRCEECQGAGYTETGMHFMGNVETLCETCNGRRFDNETLEIYLRGKNIYEVLGMPVSEAFSFFEGEKKILPYLRTMEELGLGYLTLGQRSSTLSGGEAQRVKLAAELSRFQTLAAPRLVNRKSSVVNPRHSLYILDEPTTGLHNDDVKKLLSCLNGLADQGHTLICIEHHPALLKLADRVIELGPGSGDEGGQVVFCGLGEEYEIAKRRNKEIAKQIVIRTSSNVNQIVNRQVSLINSLVLRNVTTNNLKAINVTIPHNCLTVITGVSGSGKSSLAFDTIHAEARNRFMSNFSAYARSRIGMKDKPDFEEIQGLRPTFAVEQSGVQSNPRSTVGTYTGIHDLYRLLFSRSGEPLKPCMAGDVISSALNQTDSKQTGSSFVLRPPSLGSRPLSTAFSFNSLQGACQECKGLGMLTLCDPLKMITNPDRSIIDGAMDGSKTGKFYGDPYGQYTATLKAVGKKHGIDFGLPWTELPEEGKQLALNGCGDETYEVSWEFLRNTRSGTHYFTGKWQGLLHLVNEEYARKHADHRGESMMNVMSAMECPACKGRRLNTRALGWVIRGQNIAEITSMSVSESITFFNLYREEDASAVTAALTDEIIRRLNTLSTLGLSYLAVSRSVESLSHGEARRLQLAAQTGSSLSGMIYILDEPTAGLHYSDTSRLLGHIRGLIASGNTVIVVEHDREVILAADHVIDMGPGAGARGGMILAEGTPEEIIRSEISVTGKFLGSVSQKQPPPARQLKPGLVIRNAFIHNLKNFNLEIPSGGIICITGVSGSGKSSLVLDLIHASWIEGRAVGCSEINGLENFSRLVSVEQCDEFNSPLAVVATYSGVFDLVRNLFALTDATRRNGFSKNHFSYLNKSSQCPECGGIGKTRISMDFMPDVYRDCEVCSGNRYQPGILEVKWGGRNIAGVLETSISEAAVFFEGNKPLQFLLSGLEDAGLGYLKLGQPLNTLSGGEAQRLNLAKELIRNSSTANEPATHHSSLIPHHSSLITHRSSLITHRSSLITHNPTLFIFDEPTTGLHFRDIENLLELFQSLADQGNTLLVIEHDLQVIREADFIIELGPGGGDRGGHLLKNERPGNNKPAVPGPEEQH